MAALRLSTWAHSRIWGARASPRGSRSYRHPRRVSPTRVAAGVEAYARRSDDTWSEGGDGAQPPASDLAHGRQEEQWRGPIPWGKKRRTPAPRAAATGMRLDGSCRRRRHQQHGQGRSSNRRGCTRCGQKGRTASPGAVRQSSSALLTSLLHLRHRRMRKKGVRIG
ncbi:unnamed protein product [Urochloa humidicola]